MEAFVQTNVRLWEILCCLISALTVAVGAGVCFGDKGKEKCLSQPVFPIHSWSAYSGAGGQYFVMASTTACCLISSIMLMVHLSGKLLDQKFIAVACGCGMIVLLVCGVTEMHYAGSFLKDHSNLKTFRQHFNAELSSAYSSQQVSKVHPTVHSWVACCTFCFIAVVFYAVDFGSALRNAIREYKLVERRRESLKRKSSSRTSVNDKPTNEVRFAEVPILE